MSIAAAWRSSRPLRMAIPAGCFQPHPLLLAAWLVTVLMRRRKKIIADVAFTEQLYLGPHSPWRHGPPAGEGGNTQPDRGESRQVRPPGAPADARLRPRTQPKLPARIAGESRRHATTIEGFRQRRSLVLWWDCGGQPDPSVVVMSSRILRHGFTVVSFFAVSIFRARPWHTIPRRLPETSPTTIRQALGLASSCSTPQFPGSIRFRSLPRPASNWRRRVGDRERRHGVASAVGEIVWLLCMNQSANVAEPNVVGATRDE